MLFAILKQPETNILENLSPADKKEIRKIVIHCILSTDMGKHADFISSLKACASTFSLDTPEHRQLVSLVKPVSWPTY
jgi:hypothetical protein